MGFVAAVAMSGIVKESPILEFLKSCQQTQKQLCIVFEAEDGLKHRRAILFPSQVVDAVLEAELAQEITEKGVSAATISCPDYY